MDGLRSGIISRYLVALGARPDHSRCESPYALATDRTPCWAQIARIYEGAQPMGPGCISNDWPGVVSVSASLKPQHYR